MRVKFHANYEMGGSMAAPNTFGYVAYSVPAWH